jgi:hypothetical protein
MAQITVAEARRKFGSNYHIARLVGVHKSTVGRWGRMVPKEHAPKLVELPAARLKRGRETTKRLEVNGERK